MRPTSRDGTATACRSRCRWRRSHGRVGQKLDAEAFRAACREYALAQVDAQRSDFKRLGVLGDWDHPYLTMMPRFEADQLRAFGGIIRNGHVYKGYKPVHWCLNCRSALAEAEVEYEEQHLAEHLRALRGGRSRRSGARASASGPQRRAGVDRDLDHDAVDAAGEPGGRACIRSSNTRWSSSTRGRAGARWCWRASGSRRCMPRSGVGSCDACWPTCRALRSRACAAAPVL